MQHQWGRIALQELCLRQSRTSLFDMCSWSNQPVQMPEPSRSHDGRSLGPTLSPPFFLYSSRNATTCCTKVSAGFSQPGQGESCLRRQRRPWRAVLKADSYRLRLRQVVQLLVRLHHARWISSPTWRAKTKTRRRRPDKVARWIFSPSWRPQRYTKMKTRPRARTKAHGR